MIHLPLVTQPGKSRVKIEPQRSGFRVHTPSPWAEWSFRYLPAHYPSNLASVFLPILPLTTHLPSHPIYPVQCIPPTYPLPSHPSSSPTSYLFPYLFFHGPQIHPSTYPLTFALPIHNPPNNHLLSTFYPRADVWR